PVHPIDHVVAHIHRVGIRRQNLYLEGIAKAGSLKGLIPPGGAFYQRAANWFGSAAVHVVHDRPDGIRECRVWIFLLQAMSIDPALLDRFRKRRSEIVELDAKHPDTRVEPAWFVIVVRKLNQRMMLAHTQRLRGWSHLAQEAARIFVGGEGQNTFDLGIQ